MPQVSLLRQAIRYLQNNPLVIVTFVTIVLGLVLVVLPIPLEQTIFAPQGETDRFLFGGAKTVGQQFAPPTGLTAIRIPVGPSNDTRGPFILHLREQLDGPDVRSSVVFAVEGEEATFSFTPLLRPPPAVFWVLEAPHAPTNSFWVYREKDATKSVGTAVTGTTKVVGNFGFVLVQRLPLLAVWFNPTPTEAHWNVARVNAWEWYSLIFGGVAATAYATIRRRRLTQLSEPMVVWGLIGFSVVAHIFFAAHFPLVNDEGAYIQDVVQAKPNFIPLRDYLTKGPVYLVLLKIWQLVTPHTILAWRLFAAVSWGAAIYTVWHLTRQITLTKPMRLVAVALMAISPAVIALTTPLLLQTTSVPIMLLGVAAAIAGSQKNRRLLIMLSALLVNVAFFVRVSSLIGGLIALLCIIYYSRQRWRHIAIYIGTGCLVFVVVFIAAVLTVGWQRALVTINAEALLISSQRAELAQTIAGEPLIRQLTHEARLFWRGAPLLILGLFAAPLIFVSRRALWRSTGILLGLLATLYLVFFHLSDANYLLPARFALTPITQVALIFGGIFTLMIVSLTMPIRRVQQQPKPHLFWLGTLALWLVGITFLYVQWGRFRQNYLVEFIPPLALLSGIGLVYAWHAVAQAKPTWLSALLRLVGVFLVASMAYQGMYMVWQYPHTGSLAQGSFRQFIIKTQQVVPPGEVIFTAQPNVTAFSGRPIIFGNAHPGWYREARLGTIPESLRDLFFVHPDQVTQYLQNEANYVVMERRTFEIYFDGYPERRAILENNFTKVISIDNEREGEPIELYERTTAQ